MNAVCMSLSPFVSFQSRFVTYLLTYPRTFRWANQFADNLITTMFYWVQPNQLADRLIITFFYWVDSTKLAAYLSTFLKLSLPCILLNIHSYVGNSISKLQIKIATYVFELSAGNCHRQITALSSFIVTHNDRYAHDCTDVAAVTRWRRP